jgi:predicted DNA-binding WGR domain protein
MPRRFELSDGKSNKFWEVALEGSAVTVRFGKIGTAGQTQTKQHPSDAAARNEHDRLVAEKLKKGYVEATGVAPPKPAATKTIKEPEEITALRQLANEAREGAEPMTRTYLLVSTPAKGPRGVMRAGGPPIGVDGKTRPKFGKAFMHHLITLDLDEVPELRAYPSLKKARAVALFISDARDNFAVDEDTKETKVVSLSAADLARGEWAGPTVDDPPARTVAAFAIDVPTRVFEFEPAEGGDGDDFEDESPIADLQRELMSACRACGEVIHWSGKGPSPEWLFQFNEDLVDVNLGDAGTMYVHTGCAWWAGH